MEPFSVGWIIAMVCMIIILGLVLDRGSSIMQNADNGCLGAIVKTITFIVGLSLSIIVALATFLVIVGPPPGR